MRSKEELENALEYFQGKWPSIVRNENDVTVANMRAIILALEWSLGLRDSI